jgi:hypothetical protein
MKRSILRVAIGVLGFGLMASVTTGCPKKPMVPPDMAARIEAAANKAEAAASQAEQSAGRAAEAARIAQAAAAKLEAGYAGSMYK